MSIVYKYASATHAWWTLTSGLLSCSKVTDFNDAFEFRPRLATDCSGIDALTADAMLDATFDLQNVCPRVVSCFSLKPNNILMWGHYADRHRGIAIGFDAKHPCLRDRLYAVSYAAERIPIRMISSVDEAAETERLEWQPSDEEFVKVLTTKSSDWAYEEEVRLIAQANDCVDCVGSDGNARKAIEFPKEAVREIVFGVRFPDRDLQFSFIQRLSVLGYSETIQYPKARPHPTEYAIVIPGK